MPQDNRTKAREMYESQGLKIKEISDKLGVKQSTIRSWKSRDGWKDCNAATLKRNANKTVKSVARKPKSKIKGVPDENDNAVTHGLFVRYLPPETLDITTAIEHSSSIDLLWEQIRLQYAAILRAQKIMYVKDINDLSKETSSESEKGVSYDVQQAWDKQANFLSAQSRAMKTLEGLIKQYDALLHSDLATEEQLARIDKIRAEIKSMNGTPDEIEDLSEIDAEIYGGQPD